MLRAPASRAQLQTAITRPLNNNTFIESAFPLPKNVGALAPQKTSNIADIRRMSNGVFHNKQEYKEIAF